MAGVSRSRRVSVLDRNTKLHVIDQARESAVSNRLQLSVPSRSRQPYFELDIRIGSWLGFCDDAAECRQTLVERGKIHATEGRRRSVERSSRYRLRNGDTCIRNLQCREILACVLRVRARTRAQQKNGNLKP